jgi:DNA-binding IclR family transcriptional regulator
MRLADIRRRQSNLHEAAMPIMRQIRNTLGETVVLSVRSGDTRVHIDAVDGTNPLRRTAEIGVHAPLYAGASSKVLMAGMADDELEDYIANGKRVQIQKNTIIDAAELRKEIATIRRRGYAESRGEFNPGGGAIATPIKNFEGATVAAIDVLTAQPRYTPEHRERCIAVMIDGARQISERLGYRGDAGK